MFFYEIQGIYWILTIASVVCVLTVHAFFEKEKIKILKHAFKFEDYTNKFECHFFRFCLLLKVIFYFWVILYSLSYSVLGNSSIAIDFFKEGIIDLLIYDPITLFTYLYTYIGFLKLLYKFADNNMEYAIYYIIIGPFATAIIYQNFF